MAVLSAIFKGVDEISSVLEGIANQGTEVSDRLESIGSVADGALSTIVGTASTAAQSLGEAAAATDYWTEAVGSYNQGAMEAIYSTQELVEMGYKTQAALEAEAAMAQLCADAADQLAQATDATANIQDDLTQSLKKASMVMTELADNDKVAAGTKDELRDAMERAERAASELSDAETAAARAAEELAQATSTAGASQDELEAAASKAAAAAEELAQANDNAAQASAELGEATAKAAEEAERGSNKMQDAIRQLEQLLVAAGIAKLVKEIADAFMEAAEAAMAFETSIAKVSTLADQSQASMRSIQSSIKGLSNEMGISVDYLSEATYQAISGSVETANAVQFVAEASKLAVGGFTDSATAVDVLTTAVNAYGLEMEAVEQVSSMLITTQNLGKTSVNELASNIGKVIPVAAAYNVEMDNLSASYAVLTKGGIETANATTYMRSMLSELGSTSSNVSEILMAETGMAFAELMDSGNSLADILEILGDTVDGDTTAFANLWSSQTAGLGAMSLFNAGAEEFNATLLEMQNSSGAVSDAYETMASTTEAAKSRMETAHANMVASFGDKLLPILEKVYNAGAKAFDWLGDVIDRYPIISAAVTGLAVGVGVLSTAFAAYTIKVTLAKVATAAFGTVSVAALGPLYLVAGAIGAVAAVAVLLSNAVSDADREFNELTATSKQHYEEIGRLNDQYEEAVRVHGETSEAARDLAAQIEAETFAFESARMTVEGFVRQNDRLIESHDRVVSSFHNNLEQIELEERSAAALMSKLEGLAVQTDLTASEQMQMEAIVGRLNNTFPDLTLTIDETTGALNQNVAVVKELAREQAEQQRIAQQYESYNDLLKDQAALEYQLTLATDERKAAQARADEIGGWGWFGDSKQAQKDLKAFQAEEERLQAAFNETKFLVEEQQAAFEAAAAAMEEAASAAVDYETGVVRAVSSVKNDLVDLMEAYGAAYEAAFSSIQGQYSLWDDAAKVAEKSANSINSALESQISYWQDYNANISGLTDRGQDIEGLTEMIASFADGSADSVNAVAGMASATDAQLAEMVANWQTLQEEQEAVSSSLADLEVDFDNSLGEIEDRMVEAVENMTMEAEAKAAARATMQAYIDGIHSMTGEARIAFANAANAEMAVLGAGVSAKVTGYASGTASAERGLKWVGEDGPELMFFEGGETVIPNHEVDQFLTGTGNKDTYIAPPTAAPQAPAMELAGSQRIEKKITLELEGKGSIEVGGGNYDEGRLADYLLSNLKPVLMSLLKSEVLEEGELAYDF